MAMEAFMARAERSMAGTREPATMAGGGVPAAMAAWVTAAAVFQSPESTASRSWGRSDMGDSVKLMDGIKHGDDVGHGRAGLQVMNCIEDEAAAGGEDFAAAQDFVANLLRGAEGERFLGIDAAAPEDQARAVLLLERGGVHAGGRALDGIDNVETGFDEAFEEALHTAAGMFETFPGGIGVDPIVDALVIGKPELAEGSDGAEGGGLRAEIGAAEEHAIDGIADAGVDAGEVLNADFALALEDLVDVAAAGAGGDVPLGR